MPATRTLPDALAVPLHRLALRYQHSPLPRFLAWWGGELRSLLPPRWRSLLEVEAAQVLLEIDGDALSIARADRDALIELARLPLADPAALAAAADAALDQQPATLRRILILPPARVLRRSLTLPAAALENLRQVVAFELDRQTPFKPEQVHYDARVARRDAADRQVEVELALVPRSLIESQLERLGALGGTLDAVDTRGADGRRLGFNLLPPEQRAHRANARVWLNLALGLGALLLLAVAAVHTVENRRAAVAELEAEVEHQRSEARAVNQLREALADAVEGANFLAVRRAAQPLMIGLLEELTTRLPDDTYLERLSYSDGQLTVTGQSSEPARLLGSLQDSAHIRSPALSGSIQPDPRTGKDRFTITAGYEPRAAEAP
ncbi:MAG TPA: PilN domain-containing protein [Xanthomonadaceae bacterium]|nr:PilN domain-containing protein [Xanthomonadaceae bacterium]